MKLSEAIEALRKAGVEDAPLEARILFERVGGIPSSHLYGTDAEVEDEDVSRAVRRRAAREPLAYILGEWDFYKERYTVTPEVLIPRSDTEVLVDYAVSHIRRGSRIADLCTGSGCIGISTLKNTVGTSALLLDVSEGAIRVAEENAEKNGVAERARFLVADLRTYVPTETFDVILSNPPYVESRVYATLAPEVRAEPKAAFVADEEGMFFYRVILERWGDALAKDGFFAFEIGYDQEEKIRALGRSFGYSVDVGRDLGANPRVAVLKRR